jgi:hypothetical protein
MSARRWLFWTGLALFGGCCPWFGRDPEPPSNSRDSGNIPPDDLGQPLIVRYATRLEALLEHGSNVNNSFQIGETCQSLFLIRGWDLFSKLTADEKKKFERTAALLKDESGRALIKTALESFQRVFILSAQDDVLLKGASLRMLMRLLDEMAMDSTLRTAETAGLSEFRSALLGLGYRYASAALALRHQQISGAGGPAEARAAAVAEGLMRLGDFPSIKEEFREHLRRFAEEIRAKPSAGFAVPPDARAEVLVREALHFQDAAVREIGVGGATLVACTHYQQALAYLVLMAEVADAKERERYEGELRRIPLILAQLEKMMLKGQ